MLRKDIYKYLIKPTLAEIGLDGDGADILIYGTGAVETNYDYLYQIGNPRNGGLSYFQEEPSDYLDISRWLINGFNKDLLGKILKACYLVNLPSDPTVMTWNTKLAICICRVHYYRVKEKIPFDARGLAQYHCKYYNSGGKANVEHNTVIFQNLINELSNEQ